MWWTAYNVDACVINIGARIDNMLTEIKDNGKPRYTIEQILRIKFPKPKKPISKLAESKPKRARHVR